MQRNTKEEADTAAASAEIIDVANATGDDIIDTLMAVYNSWITRKIDDYNSSMYYENAGFLSESYKAGAVFA